MRARTILLLLAASLLTLGPGFTPAASAQDEALSSHPISVPDIQCEGPISLCRPPSDALDDSRLIGGERCPIGYRCECVPSCPECDDCAAEVCLRGVIDPPECRTACDCAPGLGCFDGQCIAGFAPVYCCDAEPNLCPAGEMCQARDGAMGRCEGAQCDERRIKVQRHVRRLIRRASACSEADECVQIGTSTGCGGTCGAWVNRKFAKVVESKIDHLDEKICSTYQEDGCPFVSPSCAATEAACMRGRCRGVPLRFDRPSLEPR